MQRNELRYLQSKLSTQWSSIKHKFRSKSTKLHQQFKITVSTSEVYSSQLGRRSSCSARSSTLIKRNLGSQFAIKPFKQSKIFSCISRCIKCGTIRMNTIGVGKQTEWGLGSKKTKSRDKTEGGYSIVFSYDNHALK